MDYYDERDADPNRSRFSDWNVVVQKYNEKCPRIELTIAQLRCAIKGKLAEFIAAHDRERPYKGPRV